MPKSSMFSEKPELSYVIGVVLGDASVSKTAETYFIQLQSKDRDFSEVFSKSLSKVLDKRKSPYAVNQNSRGLYGVGVGQIPFGRFLYSSTLDEFKGIIEKYPAEFIRGLADSEGSIFRTHKERRYHSYTVKISNTNLALLKYVKELLMKHFSINTNLSLNNRKGSFHTYRNHLFLTRKDCYTLKFGRKSYILAFAKNIGFSIKRKSALLNKAIAEIRKHPRSKQAKPS